MLQGLPSLLPLENNEITAAKNLKRPFLLLLGMEGVGGWVGWRRDLNEIQKA